MTGGAIVTAAIEYVLTGAGTHAIARAVYRARAAPLKLIAANIVLVYAAVNVGIYSLILTLLIKKVGRYEVYSLATRRGFRCNPRGIHRVDSAVSPRKPSYGISNVAFGIHEL